MELHSFNSYMWWYYVIVLFICDSEVWILVCFFIKLILCCCKEKPKSCDWRAQLKLNWGWKLCCKSKNIIRPLHLSQLPALPSLLKHQLYVAEFIQLTQKTQSYLVYWCFYWTGWIDGYGVGRWTRRCPVRHCWFKQGVSPASTQIQLMSSWQPNPRWNHPSN